MGGIYKHSHFKADPFGHGGNKRTAQINDLLKKAGINFTEVDFNIYERPGKDLKSLLKGFSENKFKTSNREKYIIGRSILKFNEFIKSCKPDYFIWESNIDCNLILAELLKKHGVPFIALPHNLESLVNGKHALQLESRLDWLKKELHAFSFASQTFTISREENWLLSVHGINSGYLPYFPTKECFEYYLAIRKRREARTKTKNSKTNVLLLGTFFNSPTLHGYIDIISYLSKIKNVSINIAGFGSEQLKSILNLAETNITVLGSLTPSELAELITSCDCAVIHQEPTSGALTRIPELLIAGLPVIANIAAGRSYFNTSGLTVYNTKEELPALLDGFDNEFAIPKNPVNEENNFIDHFAKLNH